MKNPFPYSLDNKRYHTLNYHYKQLFGTKVCKVPLSLGTTCPNRDGTKGYGGCTFCSSEGGGGTDICEEKPLQEQFEESVAPLWKKWKNALTIPYFQSYTNTYLPFEKFQAALEEAMALPKAVGISIATRPDALPSEFINYLTNVAKRTYLTVELGLQTIHPQTADIINRQHSFDEFLISYHALRSAGINVCIHLINGLPWENKAMMCESAKAVANLQPDGIKLHMLHIVKDTVMANQYKKEPFPLLTKEEYVATLCDQLEVLPPKTVIERITGDPIAGDLIAPEWTLNKLWVRNAIDKELSARNSWQGKYYK